MSTLTEVLGYLRDVEVAKATNSGTDTLGVRAESVPDQSAVGISDLQGTQNVNVGGMTFSSNALIVTGVILAALYAVKVGRP